VQNDSRNITGTGRVDTTFETYFSSGFSASYSSLAEMTRDNNEGDVESFEKPTCSGTIDYYELVEIGAFKSTSK